MATSNESSGVPKTVIDSPQTAAHNVHIIDIRSAAVELNLKDEIRTMFQPEHGPRTMPTLLLYNERGLQIFENVKPAFMGNVSS